MFWLVTKYLVAAAVVVLLSVMATRSDKVGALAVRSPGIELY